MAKNKNYAQYNAAENKKKKERLSAGQSLLTIFKGLLSNQACIDSRKAPLYFHIVVFLISLVVTWIPFLATGYTKDNASLFTASGNAEIDKGFKAVMQKDYFKTIKIKEGNAELVYDLDSYSNYDASVDAYNQEYTGTNDKELAKGTFVDNGNGSPSDSIVNPGKIYNDSAYVTKPTNFQFSFYYDVMHIESSETITNTMTSTSTSTTLPEDNGFTTYLQVYYIPSLSYHDTDASQALVNFQASVILGMDSSSTVTKYPHSYAIFTKDALYVSVYALKSYYTNSLLATYAGYLDRGFQAETNLVNDGSLTFYNYLSDNGNITGISEVYTKLHDFLDQCIRDLAIQQVWFNVLIMSAIYVGSILIATIILFVMHKRKTSIVRDVNFLDVFKEAVIFGLTPSLLSLFGFMSATYSYVILIGALLVRVVFAMNKLVPPQDTTAQNKPLYQARS